MNGDTNVYGTNPSYTDEDVFAENAGSGTSYFFNANDKSVTCSGGTCI
jgi:hypothetical protein